VQGGACADAAVKLAFIVPGGFGPDGDANTIPALASLVDELVGRHDVHVFAFASPGYRSRYALRGARVHRVEYPWLASGAGLALRGLAIGRLSAQLAYEIAREESNAPFQCFHAFWANEPGLFAGLFGHAMGVPVVLSLGGGEAVRMPEIGYGGARTRLGRAVGSLAFRMADRFTAGTTFARSFLPAPVAERTRVVPLGIDWRPFDASPTRPVGPPWRLLHVASLNLVKDQDTLLRAFARVVSELGEVTLDCVGQDALGGRVQSLAEALGLGGRVRFHGFLPPEQLAPLYRSAHVHVLSSRYESQGVVVLEAAAAGVPSVGTAVGLLPTLAPVAASIVAPGDAAGLARAIDALLLDEGARHAMGTAAQQFARAHDVVWTARAFEAIYAELLAARAGSRAAR